MKKLFEIYKKSENITKTLIRIFFIFSFSVLFCSAFSFFRAEFIPFFYTARELSFELIYVLRSGCTIIAIGTVISAYLESKNINNK